MTDPSPDLAARRDARAAEEARAHARGERLGSVRLALAALTIALVLLPLYSRDGTPWWALLPVGAAFLVLGALHARVSDREGRARAARIYWEGELGRVDERWRELPDRGADLVPTGEGGFDPRAGLAGDLDLFGPASLFQRLSRAVTPRGRRRLADWLLTPAPLDEVRARQGAVEELAAAPELREALRVAAQAGAEVPLAESSMLAWATSPRPLPLGGLLRVVAVVESALTLGTALWWALTPAVAPDLQAEPPPALEPHQAFAVSAVVQALTLLALFVPVQARARRLASPDRALARYAELLAVIEGATLRAPRLIELRARLATEGVPASARLSALRTVVERLEASRNMFFALSIGPATFWDLHHVLIAERWQAAVGPHLAAWLDVIAEAEALASLAAERAVDPGGCLPELVDGDGVYEVQGILHPLLDRRRAVANDAALGGPGSVLLLSGSNMSGKSTFLRAVGLSCVMAQAGGPVCARRLRLSPTSLATSIRVVDSLAQGTSHFYAELLRIKHVLELTAREPVPGRVLYLLDEMLHGTNSKERYIGAVAVVRHLARAGAVGVVTTHDLSLAEVARELPAGQVTNAHFGDRVDGERIAFDYRLGEGPVQSTNALRLMKAIGIQVEGI